MSEIFSFIKECLLFITPRYVTDRVALHYDDGEWSVFCLEDQVTPDEKAFIDAYGTIRTFTWFGFAAGGKVKLD